MRLADLARSFEEATIDKNDQEGKAAKMDKSLDTAAKLHKVRYCVNPLTHCGLVKQYGNRDLAVNPLRLWQM